MKKSHGVYLILFLAALAACPCFAQETAQKPPPLFTVNLEEDSCLVGKWKRTTLPVRSDLLGELELPLEQVASIEFDETREKAALTLKNNDVIHVELNLPRLEMETFVGDVSLPIELVVDVSAGQSQIRERHLPIVENPHNNHRYMLIQDRMRWEDARLEAERFARAQEKSYLATITSPEENAWLFQNVFSAEGIPGALWIGGCQGEGPEPDGGWQWVTGEEWAWTNWARGEPNNALQNENIIELVPRNGNGEWNDRLGTRPLPFLVEIERWNQTGEPEPEPLRRYVISLDDGSRIIGNPTTATIQMQVSFLGKVEALLADISQIKRNPNDLTMQVTSRFGDVLNADLEFPDLEIETSFGKITLPGKQIVSIHEHSLFTALQQERMNTPRRLRPFLREGTVLRELPEQLPEDMEEIRRRLREHLRAEEPPDMEEIRRRLLERRRREERPEAEEPRRRVPERRGRAEE